jgi:hypothetical protein
MERVKAVPERGGVSLKSEKRTFVVLRMSGDCEVASDITEEEKSGSFRPLVALLAQMMVEMEKSRQREVSARNRALVSNMRARFKVE